MDIVAEYIFDCLCTEYGDANEELPYCTADGGFQGATYCTEDLFVHLELNLPRDSRGVLFQDLASRVGDRTWCDFDPFGLSPTEFLVASWNHFCRVVTHRRRHFFHEAADNHEDFILRPGELLENLESFLRSSGHVVAIPAGTAMFRVRVAGKEARLVALSDYGPPPEELATQANRMNPPGIPMLYTASDEATAVSETVNAVAAHWVGELRTSRDLRIVDICDLPNVPSIFSGPPASQRSAIRFLRHFITEVSKPIARDDRIHLAYVPTQVVTEYLRHMSTGGDRVDGFAFRSSRGTGGKVYVLFPSERDSRDNRKPCGVVMDSDFTLTRATFCTGEGAHRSR